MNLMLSAKVHEGFAKSSTANAMCGTILTLSATWQCGSKRIHSIPNGLVSKPAT